MGRGAVVAWGVLLHGCLGPNPAFVPRSEVEGNSASAGAMVHLSAGSEGTSAGESGGSRGGDGSGSDADGSEGSSSSGPLLEGPQTRSYRADIVACTDPLNNSPPSCAALGEPLELISIALSEPTLGDTTGWLRFTLDPAVAHLTVDSAVLSLVANEASDTSGEIRIAEPFDLSSLEQAQPMLGDLVYPSQIIPGALGTLGLPLPTWPVVGDAVYFAIVPVSTELVRYVASGDRVPTLEVDYI